MIDESSERKWRSAIFLERERHANVRAGNRGYPCRAIRTDEFLYVWNLDPSLWPAGDPELHFAVGPFGDVDNTKFKSFILENRDDPKIKPFFELGFSKRPAEELYHLPTDPDQIRDIAAFPQYEATLADFRKRVKDWMSQTRDPRARNLLDPVFHEYRYYGGPPRKKR